MEQIISALSIAIPCTLTFIIAIYQFIFFFSNRISKENFFRTRKKLGIIRGVFNLIAIIVTSIFGLKYITIILAMITLNVICIDIVFFILEKIVSQKEG